MRRLALLAWIGLAGCGYYTTHKILNGGEEVKDWNAHDKHVKALDAIRPEPIRWPYVAGAGREFNLTIGKDIARVPKSVVVEARGVHAEVGGVAVHIRYAGRPLTPDLGYSETVASDRTRTVLQSNDWVRVSTFPQLIQTQPHDPVRVEVRVRVVTWFMNGSDEVTVRVLFDGSEAGHQTVKFLDAAPPSNPDYWVVPPPKD